jgi:hypothetical protein
MVGILWVLSVPLQQLSGPRVDAALVDIRDKLPPGVPSGATSVPVMLLEDGRAIRVGDLEAVLAKLLPKGTAADGPPHISAGEFGDRSTRAYRVSGSRLFVVAERLERGGPPRVSAIYVP